MLGLGKDMIKCFNFDISKALSTVNLPRGVSILFAHCYAPNFEKVDGAYCFWSVRAWVRACVTLFVPTVTLKPLKLES